MMPYHQEAVDPLDLDDYLDFNQGGRGGSPSSSATAGHRAKSITPPEQTTPRPRQSLMKSANPPNVFAGPSHQYDMHKQQTGLPMGGLTSTINTNRPAGFAMPSFPNNNFGLQSADEMFDFNAMPSNPPAFNGMAEMEMDFGSPVDGMMGTTDGSEFVDPHTLSGASPPPRENVRMYPGMHTQQAALAKQRQQQEIQRQQQMASAQSLQQQATATAGHRRDSSQRSNGSTKANDPVVEERISRLLNQMRHGSMASSNENDSSQNQSHYSKSKKPEEDMDDDERLLASEEGKKLSSKERRQLRNKVSARAFRSRRKEYISQLEGEITTKSQENDDLRSENDALRSENMRLTDLSKMLLSSPAFSNFLNDLSANGMPGLPQAIANQQQQSLARQMQQQQQPPAKPQPPKDVNPHQSQLLLQQQQQQMSGNNMNTIPESDMDMSSLDANGSWGVGMDFGFDSQVFQVTELPPQPLTEAPVDASVLSGKGSTLLDSFDGESKLDAPAVTAPAPAPAESETKTTQAVDDSVEFDESNPAYALFSEATPSSTPATSLAAEAEDIFGAVPLEKAFARIHLTVSSDPKPNTVDDEMSTADMARIAVLQTQLGELSSRLASYLP